MERLRRTLCVVVFCLLWLCSFPQDSFSDYEFVDLKSGIPKIAVSSIVQDQFGFVWIGTYGGGLYRFDGIEYKAFLSDDDKPSSISSNVILSLFIDSQDRLFVGTENGLNIYNPERQNFKKITTKHLSENVSINTITEDLEGNLFVGAYDNGLHIFNSNLDFIEKVNVAEILNGAFQSVSINNVIRTDSGQIYAGTSIGLMEYDKNFKLLKKSFIKTNDEIKEIDIPIERLYLDQSQNLWMGTNSVGVIKIENWDQHNTSTNLNVIQIPITEKRILCLLEGENNTILAGSENDGLFHLTSEGKLIENYRYDKFDEKSINSNSIWSLFEDEDERIWVGSYNSGVGIVDQSYDKFKSLESNPGDPNSLDIGSVTSIAQDESGNYWISTDGGGIDKFDQNKKKLFSINNSPNSPYKGLTNLDIQTVFIDDKNNIWAGSWNAGLYFCKEGQKRFQNFNTSTAPSIFETNSITSIDQDSKGKIWIGTFHSGLISYNPNTQQFKKHNSGEFSVFKEQNTYIRKVHVDSKDQIWVGTTGGLFKVQEGESLTITPMSDLLFDETQNPITANHVLSVYEADDHNSLWIGTRGAGICKYNQSTNEATWYNSSEHQSLQTVSSIIEDKNKNIWMSGNFGLSVLQPNDESVRIYTSKDGLLSNDFNFNASYRDKSGALFFGNYKGVDYFQPSELVNNTSIPKLHLTNFKLFNERVKVDDKDSPLRKEIGLTDSITLNHKQSVFTIEYAGINFTRPENNQYAYYLEGLEEDWNYVGNVRSATYTNLDYGDYTFKVKAANNDGIWNEEALTLKIRVLPPWWKSKVAMLVYFLLLLASVYLLNRLTRNRIKKKERLRNERIKRAQEDDLHEKKLQFFTNISHEFRTPLTLIINPLKDIKDDNSLELPTRVNEKLTIIEKNTDRLYRLINELMDFRKLEMDKLNINAREINVVEFSKEIVSYFEEEAYKRNIDLSVDSDLPQTFMWADKQMLEKIIFNVLSNAVKVTPEGGSISVEISSSEQSKILPLVDKNNPVEAFEISISDTGPGLEEDQLKKIFERFYQVDNLNNTYYGGTGIGLEVVRSFVQMHKGKVEVKSNVGEGTTFTLIFPAGNEHFDKEQLVFSSMDMDLPVEEQINQPIKTKKERAFQGEPIVQATNKPSKKYSVLLVDDNDELLDYLKRELKKEYKVTTASNGQEGIDLAKKLMPDAIITDVIMPIKDGFEFCSELKNDINTSHIPVLMTTAKSNMDDQIRGVSIGADDYIVKPFDMRLLKTKVSQLLKSRQVIFDKILNDVSGQTENFATNSLDKDFIQRALSYVNENIGDSNLSVEQLANELNLSRSQLYRKIKTLTGQTANEFVRKIRLQRAKQILESEQDTNVSEVCYQVGFSSPSYFTKCFKAQFGVLPTEVTPIQKERSEAIK